MPSSTYSQRLPTLVRTTAYLSLVTFGVDPSKLRDILLRMATPIETPVFYALLAFSALHLNGLNQQTIQLKLLTLQFLSVSARKGVLSVDGAKQHVAASMLLFSFDVSYSKARPRSPFEEFH